MVSTPAIEAIRVANLSQLASWVFAAVDSRSFEVWRERLLTDDDQLLVRADDGVGLWARLDRVGGRTAALSHLYVDVGSRGAFDLALCATARHWQGRGRRCVPPCRHRRAGFDPPRDDVDRETHAKIVYRGVIWQFGYC